VLLTVFPAVVYRPPTSYSRNKPGALPVTPRQHGWLVLAVSLAALRAAAVVRTSNQDKIHVSGRTTGKS